MVCMAMKLAQSSTPKVIHIGFGTLNPPMLEVKYSSESENGYMPIYCILSALIAASVVSESTISRYIPKIRMNSEKQVSMNESFAGEVVFLTHNRNSTKTPMSTTMWTPQKTAYISALRSSGGLHLLLYGAAQPDRNYE